MASTWPWEAINHPGSSDCTVTPWTPPDCLNLLCSMDLTTGRRKANALVQLVGLGLPWEQRIRDAGEQGTSIVWEMSSSPLPCPCFRDIVLELHIQPQDVTTQSWNPLRLVQIQPCHNCWSMGTSPRGSLCLPPQALASVMERGLWPSP